MARAVNATQNAHKKHKQRRQNVLKNKEKIKKRKPNSLPNVDEDTRCTQLNNNTGREGPVTSFYFLSNQEMTRTSETH